jgi:hypothetical protein
MKILLALLCAVAGINLDAANFKGPFKAEALAFYFVHDGGALALEVELSGKDGAAVTRIMDAEEKEVLWDYSKIDGAKRLRHDFGANAPKGIYQVRTSGKNYQVSPKAVPEKSFGVMAARCMMNATATNQFEQVFFLIPPGAKELSWHAYGATIEIKDEASKPLDGKKLDVSKHIGEVWSGKMIMKPDDYTRVGFSGMPVILCPDAATAKAINGSVEKAPDGTLYAHKFQVRMHEWIKALKPEELKVEVVDLKQFRKEFAAQPELQGLLGSWGVFTYINYQLRNQNLDPNSPKYGKCASLGAMGVANSLDAPFNPYRGKLDKRLLLAGFRELLVTKENETIAEDDSNYSGGEGLHWGHVIPGFYESAASLKDRELSALWLDGVKRTADRFSMFRASCDNQSSHWPYIYYSLYQISGNRGYKELAEDYIKGLSLPANDTFMKTGYQQEAYGPDATYQGLGLCMQAAYYQMSKDPNALTGMKIVHNFMNHSVVPEPNGDLYGSSNFAHRTAGSWVFAQYGAGRKLMRGEIPAAALYLKAEEPVDIDHLLSIPDASVNVNAVGYALSVLGPFLPNYRYPTTTIKNGKLPVQESDNFTKNFNDEFIAVRRPNYYAFTYIGKTAADWTATQRPKTVANAKPIYKWTQTQGLSVLWFPDFGAFILGMNWNGDTAQILRGDLPDGKIAYPDYWKFTSKFVNDRIIIKSQLFQAETVSFDRIIEFPDAGIRQKLDIKFAENIEFKDLYEQLPFLKNKPKLNFEFKVNGQWQKEPGIATEIKLNDSVLIKLNSAHPCSFGPDSKYNNQECGVLRIHLGSKFKGGDRLKLEYEIVKNK